LVLLSLGFLEAKVPDYCMHFSILSSVLQFKNKNKQTNKKKPFSLGKGDIKFYPTAKINGTAEEIWT